jgi:monovalent cation:H+ antiporter-2, CPA2 family
MTHIVFNNIIVLLTLGVAVSILFQQIKLPPILGYLMIGIIAGPHALGWIQDRTYIATLAEFGIVFLMFTVGLEFSLHKLTTMKRLVFGLGGLQVLITLVVVVLVGLQLGLKLQEAIIIGCVVSMSSTAIVSKQLTDQLELNTIYGNYSIAILLFQDLAAIPFFILIGSLGRPHESMQLLIVWVAIKTVIAFLLMLAASHWILRPLFREIASTHSLELFTLSALLVTLSAAWFTQNMGLSLSLGAFLAGAMLGETEFRHQIEATMRPFRDILLGLFFITIGMMFNVREAPLFWGLVLLLTFALIVFKMILVTLLSLFFKSNWQNSLRTGLITAQAGEFGFALLTLALTDNLLPEFYSQLVLGSLLFSMALSPLIIRHHEMFIDWMTSHFKSLRPPSSSALRKKMMVVPEKNLMDHVIVCGYGHVGQNITRMLENEDIEYIAVDLDLKRVQRASIEGYNVIYGDATLYEILLLAAQLKTARAIVIAFDDVHASSRILQQVRNHHRDIPIFVRAIDDTYLEKLQRLGATEVIPASLEASLMLASHLLLALNVPIKRIVEQIDYIRRSRYQLLHEYIDGQEHIDDFPVGFCLRLTADCNAVTQTISDLNLVSAKLVMAEIHRGRQTLIKPQPDTELFEGDMLLLYGSPDDLAELIENLFS